MPRYSDRIATWRGALALAVLGFAACASTSASSASDDPAATRPLLVRFVDWRSGQRLTLVDESHTDRAKLYSSAKPLSEAGTKVTTDEILEETLRYFTEQGFFARAVPGPAKGGGAQSLEVETPEGTVHMELHAGMSVKDAGIFRVCRNAFADLYNSVYQLQSVQEAPNWDQPQAKPGLKPSGGGS